MKEETGRKSLRGRSKYGGGQKRLWRRVERGGKEGMSTEKEKSGKAKKSRSKMEGT